MTDNDIIKALECCIKNTCSECPFYKNWITHRCGELRNLTLDLINHLQEKSKEKDGVIKAQADKIFLYEQVFNDKTAEIKRLQSQLYLAQYTDTAKRNIESEAIKKFAHQLKILLETKAKLYSLSDRDCEFAIVQSTALKTVDNLVKERTEQSVNYGSSKTEGNG